MKDASWFQRNQDNLWWVLVALAGPVVVCLAYNWGQRDHISYHAGYWAGDLGWSKANVRQDLLCMAALLVLTGGLTILRPRRTIVAAVALVALGYGAFHYGPKPTAEDRIAAELPACKRALQSGTKFGHQFRESSNGRELTYWRWAAWNIDNSRRPSS